MSMPFKTENGPENFKNLIKAEETLLEERRDKAGVSAEQEKIGIALSGGGIRSATFCLGVLQAISEKGLMPRFDYLSSVSGGSYIGSFFGALYVPEKYRAVVLSPTKRPPFDHKKPLQSPLGLEGVRRLRDAGRYLTPSGTSDAFYGAAIVMRNWSSVQIVIGLTLLCFFLIIRFVDAVINATAFGAGSVTPYSYTLLTGVLISSVSVLAFSSAYWLTRRDWIPASRIDRVFSNLYFWLVMLINVVCIVILYSSGLPREISALSWEQAFYLHLTLSLTLGLIAYAIAERRHGKQKSLPRLDEADQKRMAEDRQLLTAAEDHVRSKLSGWLANSLIALLACTALLCMDYIGFWFARRVPAFLDAVFSLFGPTGQMTFANISRFIKTAWPGLVAVGPPVLSYLARQYLRRREDESAAEASGTKLASRTPVLLVLTGLLVVALWAILWSAASHATFPDAGINAQALVLVVAVIAINVGQSLCFSFINLSSLSIFYASRLRRAYLGASSYGTKFTSVREDDPEDTIRVEDYYKGIKENGAPLHLINVTIAETIAGTSNLVARDRKGKPMHLTPGGIVYEGDIPGTFAAGPTNSGEELPLANWVAISGAAVSAAVGSGTSLGTSILATMSNVRLGYWWKARRAEGAKDLFWQHWKDTVQNYLFLELRGAFDGTRRERWYLTDGGHFENTGIYPLLQREVNFIVACDNGADPKYDMVDILRLVQRARIDLGAHVTFLDEAALKAKLGLGSPLNGVIGTFQQLAKLGSRDTPGGPVATLADIEYKKSGQTGTLLLIKPRLTFTEPPELLAYHGRPGGREFPQQTTGDQFFDEEQWEAYRRLGEYCAEKLFVPPTGLPGHWLPHDLKQ